MGYMYRALWEQNIYSFLKDEDLSRLLFSKDELRAWRRDEILMKSQGRSGDVEAIRRASDIVDVISLYVPLKESGRNFKGLCPFHKEKTPSFNVNQERQFFYCFGCGAGGDVFNFVMRIENMTFLEAAELLADRAGIPFSLGPQEESSEEFKKRETLYNMNLLASQYFYGLLMNSKEGQTAREYLMARGLTRETMKQFQLGYSQDRWDGLMRFMMSKGFEPGELEEAGLVLPTRNRDGYYDRFRDRLIFTIWDPVGRPIGFGGRSLEDQKGPKYLNSPETMIFEKNRWLYGLNLAKEEIRRTGTLVLVEGYMDVISAHQSGIKNVVASMGTSLTDGQVRLIRRYAKEVLIAYDADAAGTGATLRGLDMLRSAGLHVKVVTLPAGLDPDDVVRKGGPDALRSLLERALSLTQYRTGLILRRADLTTVEGKSRAVRELVYFLVTLDNAVEEEEYARRAAKKLNLSENSVLTELEKARGRRAATQNRENKFPQNNHTNVKNVNYTNSSRPALALKRAEKALIHIIISDGELRRELKEKMEIATFSEEHRSLVENVYRIGDFSEEIPVGELSQKLLSESDEEALRLLAEISLMEIDLEEKRRIFDDCINCIRRHKLDEEIKSVDHKIQISVSQGLKDDVKELLRYKNDLLKERGKFSSFQGIS
jgi:DNA primase